eukprot:CAMPEP_0204049000 /NCGR_PEP_ID=MMETSP0360-20130528/117255_1 /ASSEMBLY_ACC=CAM_ASM_000342 /TAXON_ID=268821 /ORGANISM="Scrippsiella Hangoei, Strain SHTV-5" /LENGTH=122 /DNA_ID=CAMNT_0050995849 /DNA_START=60 /DNA_END=425 /DNA_ORIENTATION=-
MAPAHATSIPIRFKANCTTTQTKTLRGIDGHCCDHGTFSRDDGGHHHADANAREHGSERMDAHMNVSSFAGTNEGATLEKTRQCRNGMPYRSGPRIGGRPEQKRGLGDEYGAGNGAQDRAEV